MSQETDLRPPEEQPAAALLVDTHVHLYDCFDRAMFFDAARRNFRQAAQALGLPEQTAGCLMLTETARDHAFESLIAQHELDGGRWRFHPAGEGRSLIAALDGRDVLTVIAGRQVVTREGLEVLALGCNEFFVDGRAVEHTIEKIIEADALAVLPYGVGKWSGARGMIVDKLLQGPLGSRLMLGDNAGRLALAGEPKQFALARSLGVWVLPGTDPLPFAAQATRAGAYGLVLRGPIDPVKPTESVRQQLQTADQQPETYGHTDGPWGFITKQFRMQLRKRLAKK